MKNLNNFLAFWFLILGCEWAFAGQAIIFDKPGLIAFRDANGIKGFYDQENKTVSCYFFFFEKKDNNGASDKGWSTTEISTFSPNLDSPSFSGRDKIFDISGNLYRRNDDWIIKTLSGQAGCENVAGSFIFDRDDFRADTYSIEREIPAISIRILRGKTNFFDYKDGRFIKKRSYLIKGNSVIVIQVQDQYSLIRFTDPQMDVENPGRVTTGWIRSADLVDPFPLAPQR
jgi:hypothetical protein